jgi:Beta/Gamma crystallin
VAKLIVFSDVGYAGASKEYRSNDPDLAVNGDDFVFASAIVVSGQWTIYNAVSFGGDVITLSDGGGPETDGAYKDYADFAYAGAFTALSIQHG